MQLRPSGRELRILDFDIETRLVGFHEAGRFKPKGSEPTAIAASFVGSDKVVVMAQPEHSVRELLEFFQGLYELADVVTGHYIRKFDLPILNGALFEHGLPMLGEKLAQDTKVDLREFAGLSASQENLSTMLALTEDKYRMSDARWRQATRLTPEGVAETKRRVVGDVKQHKELRRALLEAGALRPPSLWKP